MKDRPFSAEGGGELRQVGGHGGGNASAAFATLYRAHTPRAYTPQTREWRPVIGMAYNVAEIANRSLKEFPEKQARP